MRSVVRRLITITAVIGGCWLLAACDPPPTDHVVNSTADAVDVVPGDGVCETATEDECTLRAAVMEANADPGHDRILLEPGATYVLSLAGTGEDDAATGDLDVVHRLTIAGGGATIDGDDADRVLHVLTSARLGLVDTTITGGNAAHGGGVLNQGTLYATDARFEGNRATQTGGAIRNSPTAHALGLERVTIEGNEAPTGAGLITLSDAGVSNSTISGNVATNSGGGFRVEGAATLTVLSSTIESNEASEGGGVDNRATTYLFNTTVSGNDASTGGGVSSRGTVLAGYSTITDNEADPGLGGGAAAVASGTVELRATIVAANTGDDCDGTITTAGGNLDGDGTCLTAPTTDDQPDTDPLLGPLTDNGGPTATHLPAADSPAVDAVSLDGGNCTIAGFPNLLDQHGQPRPTGNRCDVGAVEREAPPPGSFLVDDPTDAPDAAPGDGTCATATGPCTLRAAIDEANAHRGLDSITISPGVDPVLAIAGRDEDSNATGDLDIHDDLTIHGNGATIDADGIDRVIHHQAGALTLRQLTVTGGFVVPVSTGSGWDIDYGGGIFAEGPLTAIDVTVTENGGALGDDVGPTTLVTYGGGVAATDQLTLEDSRVANNTAVRGAGLYLVQNVPSTVTATIVEKNENRYVESGVGGGPTGGGAVLLAAGIGSMTTPTLSIDQSLISDNRADGIEVEGATTWLELNFSTLARNRYPREDDGAPGSTGLVAVAGRVDILFTAATSSANGLRLHAPASIVGAYLGTFDEIAVDAQGGPLHLEDTMIADAQNSFSDGGIGLRVAPGVTATVDRSTFWSNHLALVNRGSTTLTQSTIADNAPDGAVANSGGSLVLRASTVRGQGTVVNGAGVTAHGSIFERVAGGGSACSTPLISLGWNLANDASCALTGPGDQQGIPLGLGPLTGNGGLTPTILPGVGSPALDAIPTGTPGLCDGTLPTDQRGFPRPTGAGCDVGAVEAD